MKHRFFILVITLWVLASCTPEKPILFDQAISSLQGAGYTFSTLNVPDLRCLQTASYEENKLVFMHLYCAIEDEIDMITIAFNNAYSQRGSENVLQVLNLIGFPHTQAIPEFLSTHENAIFSGQQVEENLGSWRVSALLDEDGMDKFTLLSLRSKRFLEEVGEH
jgi:uncharacterized protein YidB (DUF937 family)